MKFCENCNKTFDDSSIFCPECGQKLSEYSKCPRCGASVDLNDKFCSQCGYDLKAGNKCSNCGAEIKEGSKFCPSCGQQLKSSQIIEKKNVKAKGLTYQGKLLINYIFVALFFVASILSIVGIFGNVITLKLLDMKESVSIKYFFGDNADSLKEIKNTFYSPEYYDFSVTFFVVHSIFYFGGLIGIVISIILGVSKAFKTINYKTPFPRALFLLLLFSSLPYVSLTSFMLVNSTNVSVNSSFGWGPILLIIAIGICALLFAASVILDGKMSTKKIASRGLVSFAFVLMVFAAIFGVSQQLHLHESSVRANLGIYPLFSSYLLTYSSMNANVSFSSVVPDLYLVSLLFATITVPISLLTVSSLTKSSKAGIIGGIMCTSITFITSLLSGIFASSEMSKELKNVPTATVGLGSGVVIMIIFASISLISLIVAFALDKE